MEIVKWILIIAGIFFLVWLACMLLLKSEDKQKKAKIKVRESQKEIEELNTQLDETIQELEDINPMLEKVTGYINQFNEKVFLKK